MSFRVNPGIPQYLMKIYAPKGHCVKCELARDTVPEAVSSDALGVPEPTEVIVCLVRRRRAIRRVTQLLHKYVRKFSALRVATKVQTNIQIVLDRSRAWGGHLSILPSIAALCFGLYGYFTPGAVGSNVKRCGSLVDTPCSGNSAMR